MCGILVYSTGSDQTDRLRPLMKNRGPDYYGSFTEKFTFESSVLALREPFIGQPIKDNGRLLSYNGQIYGIEGNDTKYMFDQLMKNGPHFAFSGINGEFAFVYFDGTDLWFARDIIGRRSLLYSINDAKDIIVSSVGLPGFRECTAGVLYKWSEGTLTEISVSTTQRVTTEPGLTSVSDFTAILTNAVRDRMIIPESQTSVAVLFSGGIDCTILARIMDIVLPSHFKIELLNVAFENKRTGAQFDTPDRKLGLQSYQELVGLSSREIEFIDIDILYEEAQSYYGLVSELMYPKDTVMDLSIALAFFCASRADERSSSPILVSGLGADELFGGYSRHMRSAEHGRQSLASELELDFNRIGERNLGRDDRVCSYWGKEVRYPFLDYRVVEYAMATDLELKASSIDTKILLRRVARDLGLDAVSLEKKRAIQFGAKSAKMDPGSGRSRGTDSL